MPKRFIPHIVRILIAVIFLTVTMACYGVSAKSNASPISETVKQGGLACFTIDPPPHDNNRPPSCDELCGQHSAACTGVTNGAMNPPTRCSDPPPSDFAICRCCKVTP